jgi:hypothetical protein
MKKTNRVDTPSVNHFALLKMRNGKINPVFCIMAGAA